ncbi:MAG: NADH:ubiquinone reductase (Na(+)-transporting) subunit C [Chitinophagales bacterium]
MQRNSNSYTIIYAAVLTVVIAVSLSLAATGLQERQKNNVRIATQTDILKSVGKADVENPGEFFENNVRPIVINHKGEEVTEKPDGSPLVATEIELKAQRKKPEEDRYYPLFIYEYDGEKSYILPLSGSGLWDEIWGYIALEEDYNTVAGVSFDHKAETPGLGAEIKDNDEWAGQFIGKKVMDNGKFVSVEVVKGEIKEPEHQVNSISGATVTSNGVSDMIYRINQYLPFFEKQKPQS